MRGNLVIRLFTIKIYAYFTYFEIGFVLRGRGRFGERPQDTDCGKSDPPRESEPISKWGCRNAWQEARGSKGSPRGVVCRTHAMTERARFQRACYWLSDE